MYVACIATGNLTQSTLNDHSYGIRLTVVKWNIKMLRRRL